MVLQKNFTISRSNYAILWKTFVFGAIMSIALAETETIVVLVLYAIADISASHVQETFSLPV